MSHRLLVLGVDRHACFFLKFVCFCTNQCTNHTKYGTTSKRKSYTFIQIMLYKFIQTPLHKSLTFSNTLLAIDTTILNAWKTFNSEKQLNNNGTFVENGNNSSNHNNIFLTKKWMKLKWKMTLEIVLEKVLSLHP